MRRAALAALALLLAGAAAWLYGGVGIIGPTTWLIWGFAAAWMLPLGLVAANALRLWWSGRHRGYWRGTSLF